MLGTLTKLFMTGQIKITDKGELTMFDERAVILYFTILQGMLDFFNNKLGRKGSFYIYHASKEGSKNYIRNIINKLGYEGEKAIDFAAELASIGGWGKITVSSFDSSTKHATISIENSPFKTKKLQKDPSCHFSRGLFAGAASVIWNDDIDCVETSCVSMGEPCCTFVLKRLGDFKNTDFVKKQIRM